MSASPDFKIIMDNQFKNVKTHARLLSKAMWYEWRMKLQDGLKEGLVKIAEGMAADDELLTKKEELLASVVPEMLRRHESLKQEHENLVAVAKELADCDPSELEDARSELVSLDEDIEEKTRKIEELRQQLRESEDDVKTMASQKQSCLEEIKASDKIREECRGWSPTEIMALKGTFGFIIYPKVLTTMQAKYPQPRSTLSKSSTAGPLLASRARPYQWHTVARSNLFSTSRRSSQATKIRQSISGTSQPTESTTPSRLPRKSSFSCNARGSRSGVWRRVRPS